MGGAVGPEDLRKEFGPVAFLVTELFLEGPFDDFIDGLDLTLGLWVRRGGEAEGYAEIRAELSKPRVVELVAIVRDEDAG